MIIPNIFVVVLILIILAGFILVLFPIWDVANPFRGDKQVIEAYAYPTIDIDLLNFLRAEVEYNNEEIQIVDLINLWYNDRSLESTLGDNIDYIFRKMYGECYVFAIYEGNNKIFVYGWDDKLNDKYASVQVPLENENIVLTARLDPSVYFRGKEVCEVL